MPKSSTTTFQMRSTEEQFLGEVLPWLETELGYKRGDKRDWHYQRSKPPTRNSKYPIAFYVVVYIKGNHNALRFALRFEDQIPNVVFDKEPLTKAKRFYIDAPYSAMKKPLRWMLANVPASNWNFSGGSGPTFCVMVKGDSAIIAAQMVLPKFSS